MGDAIREAGFEPNELQTAYSEDLLIEKIHRARTSSRSFPVNAELRMKARSDDGFPSHNTFTRFGSKQQFAAKILDYCKDRTGYEDVIGICAPIATRPQGAGKDQIGSDEVVGFVYLMKSGHYYKIGRSNAVGRRQYELAIQMPEKIMNVHRTDDLTGIEDYWHRRFADKRKNREWFDLTAADVKAFRRKNLCSPVGVFAFFSIADRAANGSGDHHDLRTHPGDAARDLCRC